jgi:predicted RNase H-like HicB family nuclease
VKNQYFGDVKDYLKYGLLRCIVASGLELGVCWLLTRDDGSNNGQNRKYLEDARYRVHDPELFDFLQATTQKPSGRMVTNIETSGLLPARYFSEVIPESDVARSTAFERAGAVLDGSHVLFFDPDNGIEVKSVEYGGRGSSRYVFWRELEAAWEAGTSLVIFQPFPRQDHATFASRTAEDLRGRTPGAALYTVATPDVLFLVASQAAHVSNIEYGLSLFEQRFGEYAGIAKIEPPSPALQPVARGPRALPKYHIDVFWSDQDGRWVASVPDVESCTAAGQTPQEALDQVMTLLQRWFEAARDNGRPVPEPSYRSSASRGG